MMKLIKKYRWYIAGGIGLFLAYQIFIRRAYVGNDPATGMAGKDKFHLYCKCSKDMAECGSVGAMPPCLVGRCQDSMGNSSVGHPCVDTGNIDPQLSKMLGVKDPGGEGIIVEPMLMI